MIVHEQLSFQDALSLATKRIFETKGRSRRSEFWWAMLVAYFISNFLPPFWLVTIPISIRRLHDTGRSGWWMFFPVVATIIIVLMCVSDVLSFMTMDDFEDTITPFVRLPSKSLPSNWGKAVPCAAALEEVSSAGARAAI